MQVRSLPRARTYERGHWVVPRKDSQKTRSRLEWGQRRTFDGVRGLTVAERARLDTAGARRGQGAHGPRGQWRSLCLEDREEV